MALYTGINGVVKKASSIRQGVGGVVKTLTSGKVGVSGVAREFWAGAMPNAVEIIVSNILGSDLLTDGSTQNTIFVTKDTAAQYGAVTLTSNSITITGNVVGKVIRVDAWLQLNYGNGITADFVLLNNTDTSYSAPFAYYTTYSGYINYFYWSGVLGSGSVNLSSTGTVTKTITNPNAVESWVYCGAGITKSVYAGGSFTQRLTFNNITINGKSFTPKIVSVPSGWTVPT